jgi:hypothetical protein
VVSYSVLLGQERVEFAEAKLQKRLIEKVRVRVQNRQDEE